MSATTLVLNALFYFSAAAIYGFVGARLSTRALSKDAQLAWTLFAVWWAGLALSSALTGSMSLLAASGKLDLALYLTVSQFQIFLICVILWGLVYYLAFLFSGRSTLLVPLSLFYVGYYLLLNYFINLSRPDGILVEDWQVQVHYAREVRGLLYGLVIALLLVPQILGAISYLTLLPRLKNRTQRYRVLLVGLAILVWFGSALVASADPTLSHSPAWQATSRLLGLAAALTILAAYLPPRWVRGRFAIESMPAAPVAA